MHDFVPSTDGGNPWGTIAFYDGKLLGTAHNEGPNNTGTFWSLDLETLAFDTLHSFVSSTQGRAPIGGALLGDRYYGTTRFGGSNGNGTLWSMNLSTNTFTRLTNFGTGNENSTIVEFASSGTRLFGATVNGGSFGGGVVWRYDTSNGSFVRLRHFFEGTDGRAPGGGFLLLGDKIIGANQTGGANGGGTLWSLDINTNSFTELHEFTSALDGDSPIGQFALDGDTIYGVARLGGSSDHGTLWSYDFGSGSFAKVYEFNSSTDGQTSASDVIRFRRSLFGTTYEGGPNGGGTLWQYNLASNRLIVRHEFTTEFDGVNAGSLLLRGTTIYGISESGGVGGAGTIWSFQIPEPSTVALLASSAVALGFRRRRAVR